MRESQITAHFPIAAFHLTPLGGNSEFFHKYRDILIWMVILLISTISAQISTGNTEGLVAYYPFNHNTNDLSGNENHGSVNGAQFVESDAPIVVSHLTASVTGRVLWNELPVAGSGVQIKEQCNFYSLPILASDITDEEGFFTITDSPIGEYWIYATAPSAEYWGFVGYGIITILEGTTVDAGTFYLSKKLELIAPAHNSTISTTTPTMIWKSYPDVVRYHVDIFNNETHEAVLREDVFAPDTSLEVVTPLILNTRYSWSVHGDNSEGHQIAYYSMWLFTISYPSTFTLNTTVNFTTRPNASDYSATDYRIIGLPGASDLSVGELLSGNQDEDWQVFWDNGAASDYLVEYDGSAQFRFSTGRAFWLIHKGPWSINTTVPTASLNASGEVNIPLRSGWNLITNPFTSSVPWSTIQNINGISQPIYSYSGSFDTPSDFSPYRGYYYFNEENLMTLSIPYTSGGLTKTLILYNEDDEGWKINIALSTGDILEQTTWFGVSPDASRGKDRFDYRKPRTVGFMPYIYFDRPKWDPDYSTFATDIRPEFSELETWNFSVNSEPFRLAKLSFENVDTIPAEFECYLIDEERARYVNLREVPHYSFTPVTNESNFLMAVGKENVIAERLASVLPKKFALGNNFPNPFNAVTAIPVDIPFQSDVTLTIYDLLGREVTTLYSGLLDVGRHFFTWNGRDQYGNPVSTGIYIARLNTSTGVTFSGKMVLIK